MQEWDREWQLLVNSADLKRLSPTGTDQLPYDFLEQFHVFVLANILQRPIIIVGEPYLRSMTGDSIEPNGFVGIYLPLMWSPMLCMTTPIVLAFLMDHFLPLTCRTRNSSESSSNVHAVPLVTASMEPLHVHFLLPKEETGAHLLLQQYLELIEVQAAGDSGCDGVLAAKIMSNDMISSDYSHRHEKTVRNMIIESRDFLPKCSMENCEYAGISSTTGMCIICTMRCPPYQSLVDDALQGCFDEATLSQCANVGCDNKSWLPCGGLCRLCNIGCYPRHYDIPLTAFISEFQRHTKIGKYY